MTINIFIDSRQDLRFVGLKILIKITDGKKTLNLGVHNFKKLIFNENMINHRKCLPVQRVLAINSFRNLKQVAKLKSFTAITKKSFLYLLNNFQKAQSMNRKDL